MAKSNVLVVVRPIDTLQTRIHYRWPQGEAAGCSKRGRQIAPSTTPTGLRNTLARTQHYARQYAIKPNGRRERYQKVAARKLPVAIRLTYYAQARLADEARSFYIRAHVFH